MAETTWKVGDVVKGEGLGPRVTNNVKGKPPVNTFVGVVKAVESAATSDTGDELVLVTYTTPTTFDRLHGIKEEWHRAEELNNA